MAGSCIFIHSFMAASPHQRGASPMAAGAMAVASSSSISDHECVSSSSSSSNNSIGSSSSSKRYLVDARIGMRIECGSLVEKEKLWRPPMGWPLVPIEGDGAVDVVDEKRRSFLSYGVVTPPPPPEQKRKKNRQQHDDYHVNVGYAIRSLRDELPGMFYKPPTFDIYRDDIVFRDPLITFSGIANYKLMFWGLRFYGRIFFKAIWIEIQRIWQPRDKVIMVRWTVYGIPRVPWEARGQFDGTSEYKLDSDGLIYEHKVDNLAMNSPPKYKAPAVIDMVVGAATAHTPTPSYYMQRFTWVRYYLVLRGTLVAAGFT